MIFKEMANACIVQIIFLLKQLFLVHSYLLYRIQSCICSINTHLLMRFNLSFYCILFPKQATAFNLGEQNIFKQFHYRCFYFIFVYLPLELPSHKISDFTVSQRIRHPIHLPSPSAFYFLPPLFFLLLLLCCLWLLF